MTQANPPTGGTSVVVVVDEEVVDEEVVVEEVDEEVVVELDVVDVADVDGGGATVTLVAGAVVATDGSPPDDSVPPAQAAISIAA